MNYDEKINELKLKLPEARDPVGSYVASKIIGKMLTKESGNFALKTNISLFQKYCVG